MLGTPKGVLLPLMMRPKATYADGFPARFPADFLADFLGMGYLPGISNLVTPISIQPSAGRQDNRGVPAVARRAG
jgi:hypothetical protein